MVGGNPSMSLSHPYFGYYAEKTQICVHEIAENEICYGGGWEYQDSDIRFTDDNKIQYVRRFSCNITDNADALLALSQKNFITPNLLEVQAGCTYGFECAVQDGAVTSLVPVGPINVLRRQNDWPKKFGGSC